MIETEFKSKTAQMGIVSVSVASAIWPGGSISFVHPFNGQSSRAFDEGSPFQEGLAAVKLSTGKWCHIDEELNPAYRARYDWVGDFNQGLAPAAIDGQMFHITRSGHIAYNQRYAFVGLFYEGLAAARNFKSKMLHIFPDGQPAYTPRYYQVSEFSESLAVAQDKPDGKMFFIDHHGHPRGDGRYEEARPYRQGLAAVTLQTGTAYHIDHAGNKPYLETFHWVGDFHENLAPAAGKINDNGDSVVEYFHINRKGERIYSDGYKYTHPFYRGIAAVQNHNRKSGYIDTQGRKVKLLAL